MVCAMGYGLRILPWSPMYEEELAAAYEAAHSE